jgi:superfamily II DNA or RNA helicase
VCHNTTILNQWVKVLKASYPKNKIGRYYGKYKEKGDIIVAVINSLIVKEFYPNSKNPMNQKEFFKGFGFVILDEVHEYASPQRKLIYNRAQSKYMIGLSATPDEKPDNMDNINTWHCGEILDASKLQGYSVEDIPFKGEVTMVKYTGAPKYVKILMNEKMDVVNHSGMVNQLCEDPFRLHTIVKIIFKLRKEGKNTFVFTDRRDYLDKIQQEMSRYKITTHMLLDKSDEEKISQLMGGSNAQDMENAKNNSNVILTTYQYMGTGCSIPKMDALVLATPRKRKSKQFSGRIFRLGSDYSITRKIYDVVDWHTHMKGQWYERNKYYKEKGYPVETEWVDWKDVKKEMEDSGLYKDDVVKTGTQNALDELEALIKIN